MPPRGRACKLSSINRRYPDLNLSLAPDGRFRFGRHPECEQSFPKDFRISGVHATLAVGAAPSGAVVEITDSSSNGTFVNGARLAKGARHALASGDELYLVIPSQDLLTGVGYIGSLTTNFVGYLFEYTDGLPGPPRAAAAAAAAVPAAPPEPGSPSAIGRDHAVRQTTDAPSWISRQPLACRRRLRKVAERRAPRRPRRRRRASRRLPCGGSTPLERRLVEPRRPVLAIFPRPQPNQLVRSTTQPLVVVWWCNLYSSR